ncbi:MAG: DivIVA domain-containing protein [Arthrobacter sp.]|nr:DivIVA domain-containing protein [Arthrobacter sp.]
MSFFLVFVAIVLAAVAILVGTDLAPRVFRRRSGEQPFEDGFDEPVASLPAVLLPAEVEPADVDRIRFAVGVRGYRMDQVDQVLDELRDQIARKDSEIAALRNELSQPRLHQPRPDHARPERKGAPAAPAPDPAP